MDNHSTLCAIVLAAGNSSRFGSNKLLHEVEEMPMYQHITDLIIKLKPDCAVIVTKYPEIVSRVKDEFTVVINEQTLRGQSYSMQLGIKAAQQKGRFDGFLFCVSDQPYLSLASLQKLRAVWQVKGGICALSYRGKRGNPVIFSAEYLNELMSVRGDQGGRSIIKRHLNELTLVEADDERELYDIDLPIV